MPLKTVVMHHPEVERPAEVPASSVPIHRKSGWVLESELRTAAPARTTTTRKKESK